MPLPRSLALVDDDREYSEFLSARLRADGVAVEAFADSSRLLAHPQAYQYDFYVLDLMLPDIDGLQLLKILRLRSNAGILVVSGKLAPDVFDQVLGAGADMYLAKPVTLDQVVLAIRAVYRRASANGQAESAWRLERRARLLIAPDGASVMLSDADLRLLAAFVDARGEVVSRETLQQQLGADDEGESTGGVYAAIYRLRRRIEKATPSNVPLQAKAKVGYVFKAPLVDG